MTENKYRLTIRDWQDNHGALLVNVEINDAGLDRVRIALTDNAALDLDVLCSECGVRL